MHPQINLLLISFFFLPCTFLIIFLPCTYRDNSLVKLKAWFHWYLPGQFLFSLLCFHFNPQARLSLSHTSSVFVWCPSGHSHWSCGIKATMLPQRMKKAVTDNPKKLANLIDLVNLPSTLRDFLGQSQISRLGCFMRVWSYIKTNNLQVPFKKTFFFYISVIFMFNSLLLRIWIFPCFYNFMEFISKLL